MNDFNSNPSIKIRGYDVSKTDQEHPDTLTVRDECSLDSYTFEDYLKDFELDYLGFDGVPDS